MKPASSPYGETAIAHLVSELRKGMEHWNEDVDALKALTKRGMTPGEARGITQEEYEALYGIACDLRDGEDLPGALVIALHLVYNSGRDSRFSFLAGTCLQQLGVHPNASQLFAHAILLDDTHVAAIYRLGECLSAQGKILSLIHI